MKFREIFSVNSYSWLLNAMHLKLIAVVGLLSLLPTLHEQDNVSSLKYNNGQIVDLGAGLWGNPIPYDYDCDVLYDIFMT